MTKKKTVKKRHVPHRTCIGCREVHTKRELIRIVRQKDGVLVDPTGKMSGRGAYIHNRRSCWENALKGALAKALKTTLTAEDNNRMQEFAKRLPDEIADQEIQV